MLKRYLREAGGSDSGPRTGGKVVAPGCAGDRVREPEDHQRYSEGEYKKNNEGRSHHGSHLVKLEETISTPIQT